MGGTAGRVGLGVATMGLSEGGGLRPIAEALKPKAPSPPGATPTPSTESAAVQQAGAELLRKRAGTRGWASTILSSLAAGTMPAGTRTTLGS